MNRTSGPLRLRHQIGAAIQEHQLFGAGDRVAVAVSGGMDSVVLLDMLVALQDWHQAELTVATVDHGTRPDSVSDAAFVVHLAAEYGLDCVVACAHLGESVSEARCREARYEAFASLGVDCVALAHHQEDQAETVLLQLLRGAGSRGLSAMTWRRGPFVRPFLDTPRGALEAWALERGLLWRDDPSNDDPSFTRNRVRHEVMPLLEDIRSGASKTLARSARLLGEEDASFEERVDGDPRCDPPWSTTFVATGPAPLVRRALIRALPNCRAAHIDAIRRCARRGSGRVDLGGGRAVVVTEATVRPDRNKT